MNNNPAYFNPVTNIRNDRVYQPVDNQAFNHPPPRNNFNPRAEVIHYDINKSSVSEERI
jgi:hypothetical protein